MKINFLLIAASFTMSAPVYSQVSKSKPTTAKPAAKPVTSAKPAMKNMLDSASYAIGIFTVNSFRQYGITKMNSAIVAKAIDDLLANKTPLLNDNAANAAITNYINRLQYDKAKPIIEAGEKFLAANQKRTGVQSSASGLQYEVLTTGTGPLPVRSDSVICNYRGTFLNGTVFDESYKTGKPSTFAVTGVIAGWTEALLMMHVGSKWKLYVPYKLGYGLNDYYSIPGGSALIFEIELMGIKGK